MELSTEKIDRLFLAMILLTKDLNELCGEVGTQTHPMTWSFGRLLQNIHLLRFFAVIIWKWILQYIWRKGGKYHAQSVVISCTCDSDHTVWHWAYFPQASDRKESMLTIQDARVLCQWLEFHSCNIYT